MLITQRLIIRRFTENDYMDLFEYLSNPEVVSFEPYSTLDIEQCRREAINRSKSEAFWAVCLKDNNKLIGNLYFEKEGEEEFDSYEVGYVFNKSYQGKGYATEALRELLRYGFEELMAHRIMAMCDPKNIPSFRLLERVNMRREGHLMKNVYFRLDKEGYPIWKDTYIYALLDEEWIRIR